MSALAVADAGRGWEDAGRSGARAGGTGAEDRPAQPRLFALPGGAVADRGAAEPAVAPGPPEPAPVRAAPPVAPVRTLDEVLTGTWSAVTAGHTAACPLCGGALRPRWSAGAGVVGARCADCATTLD